LNFRVFDAAGAPAWWSSSGSSRSPSTHTL
jgi:hypothetical protein